MQAMVMRDTSIGVLAQTALGKRLNAQHFALMVSDHPQNAYSKGRLANIVRPSQRADPISYLVILLTIPHKALSPVIAILNRGKNAVRRILPSLQDLERSWLSMSLVRPVVLPLPVVKPKEHHRQLYPRRRPQTLCRQVLPVCQLQTCKTQMPQYLPL